MPTAAGIIIGNEILTGKFADENGPFLIRRLRELGVDLKRLVTIADDRSVIAREVAYASEHFDHVFTTGGVGPTHDDVTLEAVAMAFDETVVAHPDLMKLLDAAGLSDFHSQRMATVPQSTELLWDGNVSFPVVSVRNVYVFPGVPKLFRLKFEGLAHRFSGPAILTRRLYTPRRESEIAAVLADAQDSWPDVDIGSYPRFGGEPWKVIVTLESRDATAVEACYDHLITQIPILDPDEGA